MKRSASAGGDRKEGRLHTALVQHWCRHGAHLHGERLLLLAWEVMSPSWTFNDSGGKFNEPSADFVFLDRNGRVVVGELKVRLREPRECWSALCQAAHRAAVLEKSHQPAKLRAAYTASWSGAHEAVGWCGCAMLGIEEAHKRFFGLARKQSSLGDVGPYAAAVFSADFGPNWESIQRQFNDGPPRDTRRYLASEYSKNNKELARWCSLRAPGHTPVRSETVEVLPPEASPSRCAACGGRM